MMYRLYSTKMRHVAIGLVALVSALAIPPYLPAQEQTVSRPNEQRLRALPSTLPLPAGANPFEALESEAEAGRTINLNFIRTPLDTRATATAQVAVRGQTLLVRMRARNVPLPSNFGVPRYALWVYVPNYEVKMYIGDLPITRTSGTRGRSDSAYHFPSLPPDAVFGGLMLTAEPIRYTPIVNEALRPLLVGLTPDANTNNANRAIALYAGSPNANGVGGAQATPTTGTQAAPTSPRPRIRRAHSSHRPSGRKVRRGAH